MIVKAHAVRPPSSFLVAAAGPNVDMTANAGKRLCYPIFLVAAAGPNVDMAANAGKRLCYPIFLVAAADTNGSNTDLFRNCRIFFIAAAGAGDSNIFGTTYRNRILQQFE